MRHRNQLVVARLLIHEHRQRKVHDRYKEINSAFLLPTAIIGMPGGRSPAPAGGQEPRVFGYPAYGTAPEYGPSTYSVVRSPSTRQAVKDIDQYAAAAAGWVAQTARGPIHCYTTGSVALRNDLYFDWHVETVREFIDGSAIANGS